jgi:hypothetical protein
MNYEIVIDFLLFIVMIALVYSILFRTDLFKNNKKDAKQKSCYYYNEREK